MNLPPATLEALYFYPIKGLSPQALCAVTLTQNAYFPRDRIFALENGDSGFNAQEPAHKPKIQYLMLMRHGKLASVKTHYEAATDMLTLTPPQGEPITVHLATQEGRSKIENFFNHYCSEHVRGKIRLLRVDSDAATKFAFTDSRSGFVSILNLASVRALGVKMGRPLDPLRFRANLHIDGWPPFAEFSLIGQTLRVQGRSGGCAPCFEVSKRIERCAATDVDPSTGARDCAVPEALLTYYGHTDCGVYARIASGGELALGDTIRACLD